MGGDDSRDTGVGGSKIDTEMSATSLAFCDNPYPTTGPVTLPPLLNRFDVKRGEVVRYDRSAMLIRLESLLTAA